LVSEGGKIVEEVNHPNFRLLADFWHMMMENEGPESIEMYGHLIHHTHIAEKEGRTAPGTHGEDFTPYFQALKNVGYKGMISIESNWDDMDKRAGPAIKTIRAQLSRLK
jgi:sugar phosphate isomerase/epimerase